MKAYERTALIYVGGGLIALFALYQSGKIAYKASKGALDPTSDTNIFYRVFGGGDLGVRFYEWLNSDKINESNKAGQVNPKVKKRTGATSTW